MSSKNQGHALNDHGNNLLVRYQNVVRGAIGRQQQRTKNDKWRDLNSRSALRGALLKIRERLPRGDRPEFFEWFDRLAGGLGPDFYSTMVQDLTVSVSESRSLTVSSELEWIGFRLRAHLESSDISRIGQ